MYNVKVVASKVPLTVGGNVHTTFGRKKSGENLHFLACMLVPLPHVMHLPITVPFSWNLRRQVES
jgi:hypothetical protein